ncbi:hypothetical protein [Bacillus sp. NTK034]|uniref:hypothetical protein n=1 Tax=Bacillus sp. NTK034 TaxID=2802176 RepID=UPI001A8C8A91|nr:hypothetical protein [Bacillus sp. NTK034]MBN8203868.1 hypothetical protein [Bacillus sp. NTK034]
MSSVVSKKTNLTFLNKREINRNIDAVIDYHFGEGTSSGIPDNEKKGYFIQTLNALQQSQIPFELDNIKIIFDSDILCEHLINNYLIEKKDTLDDKHLFNEEERREIVYNVEKALDLIKLLHPDLHYLINKHIGTLYFIKKEGFGGGSVSGLLGLIWLNPPKRWTVIDYAEALYHEFIHNRGLTNKTRKTYAKRILGGKKPIFPT